MLTVSIAASRLGITPGRVRQLIASGRLKATRVGRDWLIDADDLREFAALDRPRGYHIRRK